MPKRDPVLAALGQNVRRRREAKELTQEKLAEKAGLDPTYISGIEHLEFFPLSASIGERVRGEVSSPSRSPGWPRPWASPRGNSARGWAREGESQVR